MDRTIDWFLKYLPTDSNYSKRLSDTQLEITFSPTTTATTTNQRIYFVGQAKLTVKQGQVRINGFRMTSISGTHYVCSSKSHAVLCLEYITTSTGSVGSQASTVVVLESVCNGLERIQHCQAAFQGILSMDIREPISNRAGGDSAEGERMKGDIQGLWLLKHPIPGDLVLYEPIPQWHQLVSELESSLITTGPGSTSSSSPVIVVCGPRKVGKSSFCRFLVNSLLSDQSSSIVMVDLDCGQTEFVPPGTLSARIQSSPLLDPPFTHVGQCDLAYFVGVVTPAEDLSSYLKGLTYILTACLQRFRGRMPIVINTMGWITGLGFHLLQYVLQFTRPTHAIGFSHGSNLEEGYISPALYERCPLRISGHAGLLEPLQITEPRVSVAYVSAVAESAIATKVASPSDLRSLSFWSYFFHDQVLEMYDFSRGLAEIVPYCLPWDNLRSVRWSTYRMEGIPQAARRAVENASLVALGFISDLDRDTSDNVMTMLGMGFVRGLDPRKRCYYIVSPLKGDLLDKVNAISFGTVMLPPPLVHYRNVPNGPYLSLAYQAETIGSASRKVRYNIQRGSSNIAVASAYTQ